MKSLEENSAVREAWRRRVRDPRRRAIAELSESWIKLEAALSLAEDEEITDYRRDSSYYRRSASPQAKEKEI